VLNISNMNNILNLITDFKTMKMCLDVEYNSDFFSNKCLGVEFFRLGKSVL
jgi:hypothetical protein